MRHFLSRALERAGHEVLAVAHGADAMPVLAESRFDVLIADIVMPEMDGIELSRRAGEIDPGLPVVFITGFAAVALDRRAELGHAARVLSKPFHLRELVEAVERVLAVRRPDRGRSA